MIHRYLSLSAVLVALLGCEQPRNQPVSKTSSIMPAAAGPTVLFLGTSLTAGYGIDPQEAYPALIQQMIDSGGLDFRVVNAGLSGETSAGALRRADWVVQQPIAVLVLETGANDGLRGLPADSLRANIQGILDRAKRLRPAPRLVLVGMKVPPNYGRAYGQHFESIYPELAKSNGAVLVPFLLEGVGGVRSLNQPDGVHPTVEGQRKMAETVWRVLEAVLRDVKAEPKNLRASS